MQHVHPPGWVEAIGWLSLCLGFASAVVILIDIFPLGHRQRMWIMNVVYPVTALYWGPVALWFYVVHGRLHSRPVIQRQGPPSPKRQRRWALSATAIGHCGAGCTLGDIGAEWLVFTLGLMLAGKALYADYPLDFAFAWLLGIVFQYFTIVPMRSMSKIEGIWAAIKADTLSIVAFQLGLFLGMYIYQELIFNPGLTKASAAYWMMMQLSMIFGFFTAWPVNAWLLRAGWKERM